MPGPSPLPPCDVLVLSWGHTLRIQRADEAPRAGALEVDAAGGDAAGGDAARREAHGDEYGPEAPEPPDEATWEDPVWRALLKTWLPHKTPDQLAKVETLAYERNFNDALADLLAYDLAQAQRRRPPLARPRLRFARERCFGRYYFPPSSGRRICLFTSHVRLVTGGPSLPVERMLAQLLEEARPQLVLSVGLGGAVHADQRAGDVVVAHRAQYRLVGELNGYERNGRTFDTRWRPPTEPLAGLQLEKLGLPPLQPPSASYDVSRLPCVKELAPLVSCHDVPLLTAPRANDFGFAAGAVRTRPREYYGDEACATEMDAAPVAAACERAGVDGGFVVGLTLPLLVRYDYDDESELRNAWGSHFLATYAAPAAAHAARVTHALAMAASSER